MGVQEDRCWGWGVASSGRFPFPMRLLFFFATWRRFFFTSRCHHLCLALIFSPDIARAPPSPYIPSSLSCPPPIPYLASSVPPYPLLLLISFSCWWHLKPIRCFYACKAVWRQGMRTFLSDVKDYREKAQRKPVVLSKDQQYSCSTQGHEFKKKFFTCTRVCVCVCGLVWRGGLDNVCILQHKRLTGCLQIVWLILIAARGLQSQEPVVKYSINLH